MLSIRREQMAVFEQSAWRQFEDGMVAHCRAFSPRLCQVLGDEQLRVAVSTSIGRARAHGLRCKGPVRLFVELTLLCGSAFDDDPQYPRIGAALLGPGDEMERAERMHVAWLDYLDSVAGAGAENVLSALAALSERVRAPLPEATDDFAADMLDVMAATFPQKVRYLGRAPLLALIDEGRAEAAAHGISTLRGNMLVVALMFSFGHGCTRDPLYPWIGRTLADPRAPDPLARAQRLERKALIWLDHVLAASRVGGRS